jgi:Na+-transporting methylmalonyl-CoA/oxaloacetate decarboxylase gamma subunit
MSTSDLVMSLTVFVAVMVVMAVLVTFIHTLSRLAQRSVATVPEVSEGQGSGEVDEGLSPELIAVLAAAATEALGTNAVIHRVRLHRDADHPGWSSAGRMDIMLSHRVGPRR